MKDFEILFEEKITRALGTLDPAHDICHVKRVVKCAKDLARIEKGKLEVILPAAWLHDLINLPKNHSQRKLASAMAAQEAILFLREISYPEIYFNEIFHAIHAHSFSSGIKPETLEAQIVQDADRLDGLGAIGIARLFSISTQLNRPFYNSEDPFALRRELNDQENSLDHIEIKLSKTVRLMNTEAAKNEAHKRFQFIVFFLDQLRSEI
jgi:uncharacterized protein